MKQIWKYLREKFASTALPVKPVVSPNNISDFLEKPFLRETVCHAMKKAIGSPKGAWA
jgi:hypothetical protein